MAAAEQLYASAPVIRRAASGDLARIEAIVTAAYEKYVARIGKKPGPMLDDYAARVANGEAFVYERDGVVAGVLVLIDDDGCLLLDNVAVAPDDAGRGIGRALIEFADEEARRRGYAEIRLYTHEKMTENIAMYPRLGYEETHRGEQAGYQRVFMRKKL